jgi:DNA-binding response OmpR family regulator
MPEDRQECLAAGMDDFIAKPIRVDELVAALSRSRPLGRSRPEAAGASMAPVPGDNAMNTTYPAAVGNPVVKTS